MAWLSLDPDDNDTVRFWRYVLAALGRAGLSVGDRLVSLLDPPNVSSRPGLATALMTELEGQLDEVVLVLDDYHVIESAPINESVGFLEGHLPCPSSRHRVQERPRAAAGAPARLRSAHRAAGVRASVLPPGVRGLPS